VDIKAYIESGLLEAYVLDALPADERARVAADVARHPELAAELAAIEAAMHSYAAAHAKEPPAQLREQIWDAVNETTKIIPLTPPARPVRTISWSYAAAWLLLLGSVILNIDQYYKNRDHKEEQLAMQQQMTRMQQKQEAMAGQMKTYQDQLSYMADPEMNTVVMRSPKGDPMYGRVYWKKATGDVYLSLHGLPVPPQGKQYQLWVIKDGKPVDMGVISNDMVGKETIALMTQKMTGGQAFAISLEKEGGSPTPTMEQIFVMGGV
jgi:anti-sigma-K factor RskA